MTVELIQPQLMPRRTDKTELIRVLSQQSKSDLRMEGIAKLADLTVSDRISFKLGVEPAKNVANVIYWQSPGPRAATSGLVVALRSFSHLLEDSNELFVEEHSQFGWGVGTVYDLLNRADLPLEQITQRFEGSTIVLAGATTRTPFLIRSITPSARLIVIDTHAPRAIVNRDFDRFIRVEAGDNAASLQDVARAIMTLTRQNICPAPTRPVLLKGQIPVGKDTSFSNDEVTFILGGAAPRVEQKTPIGQIKVLFEQSVCVLVPRFCKQRYASEFHGDMLDQITMLTRLLGLGTRLRVIT